MIRGRKPTDNRTKNPRGAHMRIYWDRGITNLAIAQDNDAAGISSATACAARGATAGNEVVVTNQSKKDLNEEVVEATNVQ
jgi:hypothetical protein